MSRDPSIQLQSKCPISHLGEHSHIMSTKFYPLSLSNSCNLRVVSSAFQPTPFPRKDVIRECPLIFLVQPIVNSLPQNVDKSYDFNLAIQALSYTATEINALPFLDIFKTTP